MKEIKETVIAYIEKFISWVTYRKEPLYYYIRFRVAMACIFSLTLYNGKAFYTMKELENTIKESSVKEKDYKNEISNLKKEINDLKDENDSLSRIKYLAEGGMEIHTNDICETCIRMGTQKIKNGITKK
jgi:hypothetical protein